MKIYVDELPKNSEECLFHGKWHPYPPIVEETGYWECTINNSKCNIKECKYLQVLKDDLTK